MIADVPGEKIWIELKLILRGRFAGHIMRTILEQQFAPILGAQRCLFLFHSNLLVFFPFGKGLPESSVEMFELENRWLRCVNHQPEPMTLLVTLFDDQEDVKTN
jgi:hypothetical protein